MPDNLVNPDFLASSHSCEEQKWRGRNGLPDRDATAGPPRGAGELRRPAMTLRDERAAGAPAAHASTDDLSSARSREVAALRDLDVHGLRLRWRKLFRRHAPPHLPKYLLFRIIAYRIQANALSDPSIATLLGYSTALAASMLPGVKRPSSPRSATTP